MMLVCLAFAAGYGCGLGSGSGTLSQLADNSETTHLTGQQSVNRKAMNNTRQLTARRQIVESDEAGKSNSYLPPDVASALETNLAPLELRADLLAARIRSGAGLEEDYRVVQEDIENAARGVLTAEQFTQWQMRQPGNRISGQISNRPGFVFRDRAEQEKIFGIEQHYEDSLATAAEIDELNRWRESQLRESLGARSEEYLRSYDENFETDYRFAIQVGRGLEVAERLYELRKSFTDSSSDAAMAMYLQLLRELLGQEAAQHYLHD